MDDRSLEADGIARRPISVWPGVRASRPAWWSEPIGNDDVHGELFPSLALHFDDEL